MEKPGSGVAVSKGERASRQDAHLIDRPESQSSNRRTAYGMLTGLAWLIYLYLWLPLVTLLIWWLGVKTAYVELYLREQRIDTFLLLVVPLIIIVVAIVLLGWAEYNRHRFQHKDRRQSIADVTHAEIAAGMGASATLAQELQRARHIGVDMNEAAMPVTLNTPAILQAIPTG